MQWLNQRKYARYSLVEWGIIAIFAYFFLVLERQMLANLIILIVSVVIHELAHGLAAFWCGDSTAKYQGRLTLNPIPHIDPIGSVILPLMLTLSGSPFLFGWAKPVPVNVQNLNHPMNDMVKVAIAGPLSNLSLAVLFSQFIKFHVIVAPNLILQVPWLIDVLKYGVVINIVLAVFNMIPIPPMDGSRVLYRLLPYAGRSLMDRIEPYGMWIIIFLAFFGIFDVILRLVSIPLIQLIL
ncbi:MAG: site-2 protease family protein [Candidatus Marinamargulisbacteria bacterium]